MFKPENDLETLMQAAVREPRRIPAFYTKLLESELYILTPETALQPNRRRSLKYKEKINVATVEFQGLTWVPTFTSKPRISDYVKEPEVCLGAAARDLFAMLLEANFWLNPLSECQKPMPASEVALLLNGRIFDLVKAAN